ncbi:hypothetical protein BC828DRAFT_415880 [Blastocladiella britannica]|nr:hypothetical protein BC828DRAFT_415880 [Blastocladiella britannica]
MRPTQSAAGSALYEYSADRAFLAVVQKIADAERITLWRTADASVIVDHTPPERTSAISVAWGSLPSTQAGKSVVTPLLAICLSTGDIQLLSALDGSLLNTLTGVHASAVNAFTFVDGAPFGYSAAQDDWIVKWNLSKATLVSKFKTGSKATPKRILAVPAHDRLIVTDSGVHVFSLSTHAPQAKLAGHASDIHTLAVTADGKALLTAAAQDRHVHVYDLSTRQPLANLSLDHDVLSLSISAGATAQSTVVAAVAEDGSLGLWSAAVAAAPVGGAVKKGAKRTKAAAYAARDADSVLRVESKETGEAVPLTSVALSNESKVIVTRGPAMAPVLEHLSYLNEDNELVATETLVRSTRIAHIAAGSANAKKATYRQGPNTSTLHAADVGLAAPSVANKKKSAANAAAGESSSTAAERQLPLAERIAALQMASIGAPLAAGASATGLTRVADAGSLHVQLSQALHSSDRDLLESVLGAQALTATVINATVRKLPASQVVPLLHAVMDRFMRTHARAPVMLEWLRSVITVHAGYLMTVPDLVRTLAAFHRVLERRIDQGTALLKLQGRLDLVLHHVDAQAREAAAAGVAAAVGDGASASVVVVDRDDGDRDDDEATFEDMRYPRAAGNTLRHASRRATPRSLEELGDELNADEVDGRRAMGNGDDDEEEDDMSVDHDAEDQDEMEIDDDDSDSSSDDDDEGDSIDEDDDDMEDDE